MKLTVILPFALALFSLYHGCDAATYLMSGCRGYTGIELQPGQNFMLQHCNKCTCYGTGEPGGKQAYCTTIPRPTGHKDCKAVMDEKTCSYRWVTKKNLIVACKHPIMGVIG
uniref:uncharacterized protein LOC120326801 n=1 Tax=Styela clava TaxID=7725 RepID=UPI00193A055F|nr:uncharacterized protein LOC120326801 [Styela clava]